MPSNVRKQKLLIRFHDPNPPEESARIIAEVCVEAGRKKLERTISEVAKVCTPGKQSSVIRPSSDTFGACS